MSGVPPIPRKHIIKDDEMAAAVRGHDTGDVCDSIWDRFNSSLGETFRKGDAQ